MNYFDEDELFCGMINRLTAIRLAILLIALPIDNPYLCEILNSKLIRTLIANALNGVK